MTKRTDDTPASEIAALTGLLDYAFAMARDLDQPFLAHLIRMAADESRRARDGGGGATVSIAGNHEAGATA